MGVLNVTPDSFFDGGRFNDASAATARIDQLLVDGADVIDIGAESTRPGAPAIAAAEQIARLEPALLHALRSGALVSVDTTSPVVARHALGLGAHLINDVSCLADDDLARACVEHDAPLVIMHSRGPAAKMAGFSVYPDDGYADVIEDVRREWRAAKARAVAAGMPPSDVYFDPGLGFAKNADHNWALLAHIEKLESLGRPLLIAASRKNFLGRLLADQAGGIRPAHGRDSATSALSALAAASGAWGVRAHDALGSLDAVRVAAALAAAR
jgi:dihydropteroate synthase